MKIDSTYDGEWCAECKEECTAQYIDYGNGKYEFQGTKGFHKNELYVSVCCEGDIIQQGYNLTQGAG